MDNIKVTLATQIKGQPEWIELSPDGRWLALRLGEHWKLLDTETTQVVASFALDSRWLVISTNGKHIATKQEEELIVLAVDGGRKTAIFPCPEEAFDDFIFTKDGGRLWAAIHNDQGVGHVALLDVATLEVLDTVPMPVDDKNAYSENITFWHETWMTLHLPSNMMAITHSIGDSYLGTFFFHGNGDRISPLPRFITYDNGADYLHSLHHPCFSASGRRFAAYDGPFLNLWQLPNLQLTGRGCKNVLDYGWKGESRGLIFLGENPLVAVGDDYSVRELRLVQIGKKDCTCVAMAVLPRSLEYPYYGLHPRITIRGVTLVGVSEGEILVYHLSH